MSTNNEHTNYEENPVEISDVSTIHLKRGKKRREIKDFAADLAYGAVPTPDGSGLEGLKSISIKSYPKDNSREHRILHRAYNRYKDKKDRMEFENTPLSEVKNGDKDRQQKGFTAQMNRGARSVLPLVASAVSLPGMIEGAVIAPFITGLGFAGGLTGSKIGEIIGGKIDARRHGLSNAGIVGSTIGGIAGGALGSFAGSGIQNAIISNWLKRPLYSGNNTWTNNGTPRLHYFEEMSLPNTPINEGYQNWMNRVVSKNNARKIARELTRAVNATSSDDITNYSNYRFLTDFTKTGQSYKVVPSSTALNGMEVVPITSGANNITQLIQKVPKTPANSPRRTYSTISAHFTPEGLAPGSWSDRIGTNTGYGYFIPGITNEIGVKQFLPPISNGTRIYPGLKLKPMPQHTTIVLDNSLDSAIKPDLGSRNVSNIHTFDGAIPNSKMLHILEYDPLLKTFGRGKRD